MLVLAEALAKDLQKAVGMGSVLPVMRRSLGIVAVRALLLVTVLQMPKLARLSVKMLKLCVVYAAVTTSPQDR